MNEFDKIVQRWIGTKSKHVILYDILTDWANMSNMHELNISILGIRIDGHDINEICIFPTGSVSLIGDNCGFCGRTWLSDDDLIKICNFFYNINFHGIHDIGCAGEKGELGHV